MALSRAFRFFPTLPAAACLALALGACLDNTLPVEPATESPNGTVADDTPAGGRQDKIVPFDSMSLRDRFDSSRRAMRGLEARSGGSYAYLRVRFAGWPSGPDTTRVGFAAGRAILREAWYTVAKTPPYTEGQTHILLLTIGREHYLETGDVGAHPHGEPALPLDSLYAQCEDMLPPASDPDFRFSVGPDHVLRECGRAPDYCYGNSCLPDIALESVDWSIPRCEARMAR
jgi:hypothetical protein